MNADFYLSEKQKRDAIKSLQNYFYETKDEEIGIIAAEDILNFFTEEIGCLIYNRALSDFLASYKANTENAEADFYALYKPEPSRER